MKIGIPTEIKLHEYRVSMLPVGVGMLVKDGHEVLVQRGAGVHSGYDDSEYLAAGATLVDTAKEVFANAEMIVKVKEPISEEWGLMRSGQVMFTYFHFAASKPLTDACLSAGITAVAYETLVDAKGRLPLLTPMSEVAGRMSIQSGAKCLEKPQGGRGALLAGIPGVEPARVTILGGGVVGTQAARMAAGLGANVTILDINLDRLRELDDMMPANVCTVYSDPHAVYEHVTNSDLIVGAVLVPGGRCPILITRAMLSDMRPGAVIVDVGIDQGGCTETSRPTTHADPTYVVDGIVHYCVANMPGAVGRTSTQGLCHATQPYVLRLANEDLDTLIDNDPAFHSALNMRDGKITNDKIATAYEALSNN